MDKKYSTSYIIQQNIFILCCIITIIIVLLILSLNIKKIINTFQNINNLKEETVSDSIGYTISKIQNNNCDILVTITSIKGLEYIKYIDSNNKEIELDCNNKLAISIDYYGAENKINYYFTVKRSGEAEKIEKIYMEIPVEQDIDFVSKLTESTFTATGNNYYNIIQSGGAFANGWQGVTTYPTIYSSSTGAYTYLFSKNILGHKLKRIDIEVRTRNDGINWGPASIGIVSNPGSNPTWVEGAYVSWNAAMSPSWTTYKTTINIPDTVDTTNDYFEIYLGHVGTYYTMWMDFQNLKGYFY